MTILRNPLSAEYPTKMPVAIFLDSGGVINDNKRRAPQWLRYLGEFLPTTCLGGTAELWSDANRNVIKPFFSQWSEYLRQATEEAEAATAADSTTSNGSVNVAAIFERIQLTAWMKLMCAFAFESDPHLKETILPTLTDHDLFELGKSAQRYTMQRVRADYPGAVDTIKALSKETVADESLPGGFRKRYRLCTSSGDNSEDLEIILKGIEVYDFFDSIYGSDRVNYLKVSPEYYRRVFASEGLRIVSRQDEGANRDDDSKTVQHGTGLATQGGFDEVVVVDDSEKVLAWARSLGARTVLISDDEGVPCSLPSHIDNRLSSLNELPIVLESWKKHFERA
ncbi:hypothetical protein BGZ94_007224 [Podila epigama]|nr:hypothetical protein BGZ94_007224 [Podila epigama]